MRDYEEFEKKVIGINGIDRSRLRNEIRPILYEELTNSDNRFFIAQKIWQRMNELEARDFFGREGQKL